MRDVHDVQPTTQCQSHRIARNTTRREQGIKAIVDDMKYEASDTVLIVVDRTRILLELEHIRELDAEAVRGRIKSSAKSMDYNEDHHRYVFGVKGTSLGRHGR